MRYEITTTGNHGAKLLSSHRTEQAAIKAATKYDRAHTPHCECGGCEIWDNETRMVSYVDTDGKVRLIKKSVEVPDGDFCYVNGYLQGVTLRKAIMCGQLDKIHKSYCGRFNKPLTIDMPAGNNIRTTTKCLDCMMT